MTTRAATAADLGDASPAGPGTEATPTKDPRTLLLALVERGDEGALVLSERRILIGDMARSGPRIRETARLLTASVSTIDGFISDLATHADEAGDVVLAPSEDGSQIMGRVLDDIAVLQRALRSQTRAVAAIHAASGTHGRSQLDAGYRRRTEDGIVALTGRLGGIRHQVREDLAIHSALMAEQQGAELRALSQASLTLSQETRDLAQLSLQRADESKKVSSWAAILFAPTLIGTVYGMNFRHMPELDFVYGYPLAVAAMIAMGVTLWLIFRRRGWL
ncbi:CorA family divalent cation transporter [Clavibacter zhangzhiyongii]|uniref:Magnesium transporter n=1 Tax=Clavibacter zhangzhiyongii TaxID=2768071 RepID=A0A7L7YYU9_9MICO|nr:CorA family divalent cation transporter [Clavibacter zhangzhiyongii]QOD42635.1 hypothetical protein H9X71_08230 [Clavibacter zhangzhiyongii]